MGLARLLSVGRTFGAATNQDRRYRATPGGGLPKLGPMTGRTKSDKTMKRTTKLAPPESRREEPTPPSKVESVPVPATGPVRRASAWPGRTTSWWQLAGQFLFGGWGRTKAAGVRSAPQATGRAVQQELALENVKPCRNDLSDADWEMIAPPPARAGASLFRKLAGNRGAVPASRVQASAPAAAERV